MLTKSLSIAAIALLASLSVAKAQILSSGLVTGDSSIEGFGAVVEAYNFGGSNETINGVNFIGTGNINGAFSGYTMNGPGIDGTGGGIVPTTSGGVDSNLSAALQNVEGEGVHNGGGSLYFQLTGLTVGTVYSLQLLINANSHDARTQAFLDGTHLSPTVTAGGNNYGNPANPGVTFGYDPAYITDVFRATSSTETLFAQVGGGAGAQFSGFVLETPEPGTWVMLGLGLAGLAFFGLRRRTVGRS
jgi:hypothetical protein